MKNRRGHNDDWSNQPRGGVGEHGMSGRLRGISGEISPGGHPPNAWYNGASAPEADAARREVGSVHSSDEGRNEIGAKGPNLVDVNSDAQDRAMAPVWEIATTTKVRAFQRTLCRTVKRTASTACAVNGLGKPDAGNPPVRFDEGRGVTRGTDNFGLFNPRR
jgi:hypothetical protein